MIAIGLPKFHRHPVGTPKLVVVLSENLNGRPLQKGPSALKSGKKPGYTFTEIESELTQNPPKETVNFTLYAPVSENV